MISKSFFCCKKKASEEAVNNKPQESCSQDESLPLSQNEIPKTEVNKDILGASTTPQGEINQQNFGRPPL